MAQAILNVPSKNFTQKTLDAQLISGTTASMTLNNVNGIQNLPGVVIIDRIDTNDVETANKREVIKYTAVSGSTLTGLTRNADSSGTDQDHAVGAIVEFVPDVLWGQSIYDSLSQVVVPSTGLLDTTKVTDLTTAQTLTNKTLTSPKVGTAINDTNGNEIIKTPATASAVNEITVTNAATGNAPLISATGGDTDIDLSLTGKGSGKVKLGTALLKFPNTDGSAGQLLKTDGSGVLSFVSASGSTDGWTDGSAYTWTYASASTFTIAGVDLTAVFTKGTRLKFTQTTVKYAVVVSSSFSTNTTVTIAVNTDYTIANAAISANYYSYQVNPQGFPDYFNFSSTFTWNSTPPSTTTSTIARYKIVGKEVRFICKQTNTNAGTTNTQVAITGLTITTAGVNSEYNYAVSGYVSTVAASGGAPTTQAICSVYSDTSPTVYVFFSSISARSVSVQGSYEML